MKVNELLENFQGNNHIKIYDKSNFLECHRFNSSQMAISKYGYFTVRSWDIESNALKIIIQTQF